MVRQGIGQNAKLLYGPGTILHATSGGKLSGGTKHCNVYFFNPQKILFSCRRQGWPPTTITEVSLQGLMSGARSPERQKLITHRPSHTPAGYKKHDLITLGVA